MWQRKHLLVNGHITSKKVLVFIAVAGMLLAVSLFSLFVFNSKIEPSNAAGPIEQWFAIGFERRQLEDAFSEKAITEDKYNSDKKRILASEDQIARIYPRNMTEFKAYDEASEKDARRPSEFWIALITSIVTSIATLSGLLLAWRNDRRVAAVTELKLLQLKKEPEPPTIIHP